MKIIIKSKGGPGSGNWLHKGREGSVGGSTPSNYTLPNASTTVRFKELQAAALEHLNQFDAEAIQKYNSLRAAGFDSWTNFRDTNPEEYARIQEEATRYHESPAHEMIGKSHESWLLSRMTEPPLSEKELSKAPTKTNAPAYMYQKYGVVIDPDLPTTTTKLLAEEFDNISKVHSFQGGFFVHGNDASYREVASHAGIFDSASMVMEVPKRPTKTVSEDLIREVVVHEYAHFVDANVLGQAIIERRELKRMGRTPLVQYTAKREGEYSEGTTTHMYSKEPKEGFSKSKVRDFGYYRKDEGHRLEYKDTAPTELFATMYESLIHRGLPAIIGTNSAYTPMEKEWFSRVYAGLKKL